MNGQEETGVYIRPVMRECCGSHGPVHRSSCQTDEAARQRQAARERLAERRKNGGTTRKHHLYKVIFYRGSFKEAYVRSVDKDTAILEAENMIDRDDMRVRMLENDVWDFMDAQEIEIPTVEMEYIRQKGGEALIVNVKG